MFPLAIDLYCGLGGWTEGFLAEGYRVVGFDIERHVYGGHKYPAQLVIQDVLTLHGSQFKDAAAIVASPPCQEPSYRAMCWKRAKAMTPEEVGRSKPEWWDIPEKPSKTLRGMTAKELSEWQAWKRDFPKPPPLNFMNLFDACFRIQREACEAAGRHIPLIVENVRGAEKWVGSARWHFGSYYLWGDVPAIMPITKSLKNAHLGGGSWFIQTTGAIERNNPDGRKVNPDGTAHPPGSTNQRESDGVKQHGSGPVWFDLGIAAHGSRTTSRKAASAMIAKIPFALAVWIARSFKPANSEGRIECQKLRS